MACGILVPQPGVKTMSLALIRRWILNQGTIREVPATLVSEFCSPLLPPGSLVFLLPLPPVQRVPLRHPPARRKLGAASREGSSILGSAT